MANAVQKCDQIERLRTAALALADLAERNTDDCQEWDSAISAVRLAAGAFADIEASLDNHNGSGGMSGITMCDADECPLSIACYRHADSGTRPDPHYQSYWARRPESPVGYDCAMFWSEAASLRAESARARVEQSVAEEESSIARQPPDRLKR